MSRIMEKTRFIKSKRQSKNLKHLLTCAKFDKEIPTESPGVSKCNRGNCGTCPYLIEGSSIKFKNKSEKFFIHSKMNCAVRNIIYVIICQGCGEEYIGQTDCLRDRVRVHKQQIRDPKTRCIPLSSHLDVCAAHQEIKFKIFPFYCLNTNDRTMRKIKEESFIKTLKPALNA